MTLLIGSSTRHLLLIPAIASGAVAVQPPSQVVAQPLPPVDTLPSHSSPIQDPLPSLDDYHVRVFTVADGLAGSDVRDIAQGSDGYLYVAGGRGLMRFNGYHFRQVPLVGFESRFVESLHRDRDGRLWVLSVANDLGVLEQGRVQALPRPPARVLTFPNTATGPLWLGSEGGLIRVEPEREDPYRVFDRGDGLPSDTVLAVVDLPGGEQVAVTATALVLLRAAPATSATSALPRFQVIGPRYRVPAPTTGVVPLVDRRGLWLTTMDGVLRYEAGTVRRYVGTDAPRLEDLDWPIAGGRAPLRLSTQVRLPQDAPGPTPAVPVFILADGSGSRWIVTQPFDGRASAILRERAGQIDLIDLPLHLQYSTIRRLLEDHEGSIWIGADRGLAQVSPRRVGGLTPRQGLAHDFTTAVLQDPDGALWVGTWGGGLHRFADGRLDRRFTREDGLPSDEVRTLFRSADGGLWVGMSPGMARLEDGQITWTNPDAGVVRAFAETTDADGRPRLWVASYSDILVGRPGDLRPFRPDIEWGNQIWALHPARDGSVWVGGTGGLFRIRGDSVRPFGPEHGLRGRHVSSLHEEKDGTLWIGTYEHGLHRYRGERFVPVTTREGLHHNGVWTMLDDDHGHVWMSSDDGVFRVERRRLHEVADAVEQGLSVEPLDPLVFTEAEGMPSRESNRASPGGWRLADGRLVFNNIAGVVVIDPERATRPTPPPPTRLEAVVADGHEVPLHADEPPQLPTGTRHLSFDFSALSFTAPEQNRYRYRLDGYDDEWIEAGSRTRAAYAGLLPGRYAFRVQGSAGTSPWTEAEATYGFVLPAPFWQTWWFRGTLVLAGAGMLAAGHRYRVRRVVAMERLRLRIASDLHDDVGSNLSSIALLSEMLQDRARVEGLERRQLERISRAAGETIGSLREIIWLVDPKHDNLADLVQRMRHTATSLINGTAATFVPPEPLDHRSLDATFVRQVFLIYKEALHNVAKHANARHVRIEVDAEQGMFAMRIEDDGSGFREEHVARGHGLESMRRRAEEVGGELAIRSTPGGGTCITFRGRMA